MRRINWQEVEAAEAAIKSALKELQGRRTARILGVSDVVQIVREALANGAGCTGGGTVANCYNYPAHQTASLAVRLADGSVAIYLGDANAKRGSRSYPREIPVRGVVGAPEGSAKWVDKIVVWATAATPTEDAYGDPLPPTLVLPEGIVCGLVALQSRRAKATARAESAKLADLREVPVTLGDSVEAGNCRHESERVARTYFPGRDSVPAGDLIDAIVAHEPHLLPRVERAVRHAATALVVA